MLEYFKQNFIKWLVYATIGAVAITLVLFFRDWISDDINTYNFYATKFLKGLVVFCVLAPGLDMLIDILAERFGYYNDVDIDDKEPDEVWFYQGYKNGMCVAEVVYKNPVTKKDFEHKFTYINEKGETITNDLFDVATEFTEGGYGQVCMNGKYNMINREGKYLCDEWYLGMQNPDDDGRIKVMNDDHLTNFLNSEGKLMWEEWKKEL